MESGFHTFDADNNNTSAGTLVHRGPKEWLPTRHRNVGKITQTRRTPRLLSVGGKVLCYQYGRTPLALKRQTCFAFQTAEMSEPVFSSRARNWKQRERFSLNGATAWPGLRLKFKPGSQLALHGVLLICYASFLCLRPGNHSFFFPL